MADRLRINPHKTTGFATAVSSANIAFRAIGIASTAVLLAYLAVLLAYLAVPYFRSILDSSLFRRSILDSSLSRRSILDSSLFCLFITVLVLLALIIPVLSHNHHPGRGDQEEEEGATYDESSHSPLPFLQNLLEIFPPGAPPVRNLSLETWSHFQTLPTVSGGLNPPEIFKDGNSTEIWKDIRISSESLPPEPESTVSCHEMGEEEHGTMDDTWRAIMEGSEKQSKAVLKKSETWERTETTARKSEREARRRVEEMRRRGREVFVMGREELSRRVDAFIKKHYEEERLQRLESDNRRFIENLNNRRPPISYK